MRQRTYIIGLTTSLLLAALVAFVGCGGSSEASYEYDSLSAAQAASDGKPILIDFYTDWCTYCKMMDTTTFTDTSVTSYIRGNILVAKVNAEKDSALANSYGVTGYPTLVLVEPDGSEIDRFIGYYPPEKFLPALTAYVNGEGTMADVRERAGRSNDPYAYMELAAKYQQRQDVPNTVAALEKALDLNPDDSLKAQILVQIASAKVMAQQYDSALAIFKSVANAYPESPGGEQASFAEGLILERMGDTTKAVAAYKKFVKNYPQSRGAQQVNARIQMLQAAGH